MTKEERAAAFDRSGGRCEYCRIDFDVLPYPPQIDHVIALKHSGPDRLDNLAAACAQCNSHKGSDGTTRIDGNWVPLFNPREQLWADHFHLDHGSIVARTVTGMATVKLLQMNDLFRDALRRQAAKT
jgi:5-methylcytosine-specific restriction endonuclease McrA